MAQQITRSILVKADVGTCYQIWSNFENFPNFMHNIKSVTKTGANTSHWVMSGPLGVNIEWDAETTMNEPNTRIAWNSRGGSTITTSGQVTFNDMGNGDTEVTVMLQYVPPAGLAGEVVAELFGNPDGKLEEDLHRFKKVAEGYGAARAQGQ